MKCNVGDLIMVDYNGIMFTGYVAYNASNHETIFEVISPQERGWLKRYKKELLHNYKFKSTDRYWMINEGNLIVNLTTLKGHLYEKKFITIAKGNDEDAKKYMLELLKQEYDENK